MYEVNLYGESLASYPGSSPRFLHGEEPGYEASESLRIFVFYDTLSDMMYTCGNVQQFLVMKLACLLDCTICFDIVEGL